MLSALEDRVCSLPMDKGPCSGLFPRYYYKSATKTCEEFAYGGCGGNANNFKTLHECESKCGTLEDPVCSLPMDKGPCSGLFPRYYYKSATKTCEEITYGGCGGNANNFKTLHECESKCGMTLDPVCELPKKVGPCRAHVPRYYYNTTTDTCEKFVYGGCKGNANNFETLKQCETRCAVALQDVIRANPILSREVVGLNPVCNQTKYPGPCAGYFPRYYYNNVTKTCDQFIYGGCRGNGNNFLTLEDCQNTCWVTPPEECTYSVDVGHCDAYMHRFFYNTLTKTCEQFVYGGCGGNANNFHTFDACEKKCKKVFGVVPRA
ncbi:hypothetical protein HPB52_020217 [Rhipicephalus sanguineus]|uniref:BPTI/Kunitz inhibitor domain-containing protein n=1 Tax=Rhipicephalus sanguineus TaxID=34632 RepID=A0A9D4T489_RHISA|nr:hypothetical protein HPB52_020217 [Rhipicephalus sanguineus]